MKRKSLIMSLSAVAILTFASGMAPAAVKAEQLDFTPHSEVAGAPYLDQLTNKQKYQLHRYLNYEDREPCQNYRLPPEGFRRVGCDLIYITPKPVVTTPPQRSITETMVQKREVLSTYVINFDFNSTVISPQARETLAQVAREIMKYNPGEVTVSGYADRAGPATYNVGLSKRRADVVSGALNDMGVANRVIDEDYYGETNLAVPTADEVPLRQNRRVVIEFLK